MNSLPVQCAWPREGLGEALESLAAAGGASAVVREPGAAPSALSDADFPGWLEKCARLFELEVEPIEVAFGEIQQLLSSCAPALLRCSDGTQTRFLVVLGSDRHSVSLLAPDHSVHKVSRTKLSGALGGSLEKTVEEEVEQLLSGIEGARREQTRAALVKELLADQRLEAGYLVRPVHVQSFWRQLRAAGLLSQVVWLLALHAAYSALWILSWYFLGRSVFAGRLETALLGPWGLTLLTLLPLKVLSATLAGSISLRAGALMRSHLMSAALRLDPDRARRAGIGGLLGRVMESEAPEQSGLHGGFLTLLGCLELIFAAFVLACGAAGWIHLVLLTATIAWFAWLTRRLLRRRQSWTEQRLHMTGRLLENMVGHRTRLAQLPREHWYDGDDRDHDESLSLGSSMDGAAVKLAILGPRVWLTIGVLGLAWAFVRGDAQSTALAVSIGGILLAFRALKGMGEGLEALAAVGVAWRCLAPLLENSEVAAPLGRPELAARAAGSDRDGSVLLEAHNLEYAYPGRSEPVLREVELKIRHGERWLLEGSSGGGKSTLVSLLAGARAPRNGLLLLGGLDRESLGASTWTHRVVLVPQYHDNHVLLGSFAFNLLLGRKWPPTLEDLSEAEALCKDLGLGPLLERMPGGLQQMVGETGWQLSHGERGRLFLARALLQDGDLVLLDESFAALDPATLERALDCTTARARTLLVIAHS